MNAVKSNTNKLTSNTDTIAAIATPPGRGGVGIVRVSGPLASDIADTLVSKQLKARHATYTDFYNESKEVIDQGIALFFPGPNSFTGEDVLELQGHGGPVVLDLVLQTVIQAGARQARPGEFSERAFLNDRLDLAQAEAIADLIDAGSEQAARSAIKSLQGDFSKTIQELLRQLIHLRMYIEAAIDFPEEEVDFLNDATITNSLSDLLSAVSEVEKSAQQGCLLKEGITVVIAGKPNVGKSSLLNALSGRDSAIVTDIAGTTRDVLREHIVLDGLPLHIIDTAGLHESDDPVEQEGIRRALQQVEQADLLLVVHDISKDKGLEIPSLIKHAVENLPLLQIYNKTDLLEQAFKQDEENQIALSVKTGKGLNELKTKIHQLVGFNNYEDGFIARRRHLTALSECKQYLEQANQQMQHGSGELVAEDLRLAQHHLAEITGAFSSDDLLGKIFGEFCIGK